MSMKRKCSSLDTTLKTLRGKTIKGGVNIHDEEKDNLLPELKKIKRIAKEGPRERFFSTSGMVSVQQINNCLSKTESRLFREKIFARWLKKNIRL